ncbi:DEAD/DEAH box helicase [Sphingomonas sp. HF-S4]|uniref:DEAD/DEAH box helicase n=1 Tax=Sphingomonas agrestis TaxID=3080540 RepID=A0ABU3YCW5_9SPHN|nr:DEAD/DEAH box helicase [Sphingomonas sp. HF-S4]MDV3459235.1 DEAD/DEAH box helicase [Sphingomonas sp. HF-S4]
MNIDSVSAPGWTAALAAQIRSWGIRDFTGIQTQAIEAGVADGRSMIACAPTSSGKTLVGEIAILAGLERGHRCLYLVSHRALADQKYADFVARLGSEVSIGLSTGDRDEGEAAARLTIATYEKALALLLSGQLDVTASVIVADELQIIGEPGRGPNIETLCTILKRQGMAQIVGLTATVGNAGELAEWLGCALVGCQDRDVDLIQQVWSGGTAYEVRFGQEDALDCLEGEHIPQDPVEVARKLIALGRGPVLIFTESRNEAMELAARFAIGRQQTVRGIELAEQIALFSEPTEASEQLQDLARREVAFHSADLTAQERQVLEQGFATSAFCACFATSTLAAGVNFPFRSVVFAKLTYAYGEREGTMLTRADYRNMSGRAGRLGLHPDGYAVLLPRTQIERSHAATIVRPENDNVVSRLVGLSMRRSVLALIAHGVVNTRPALVDFFRLSLLWHQIRERNPHKLDDVVAKAATATDWLIRAGFVDDDFDVLLATPVGRAVAQSGLLPLTAVGFLDMMCAHAADIDADFERYLTGLLHWVCTCAEFGSERPSRYLPWPSKGYVDSVGFLQAFPLLAAVDRNDRRANQGAHALALFAAGAPEREIRRKTNLPSGQLHRLAADIAWVLDGLRRIASVPELGYPQTLTNKLQMLARQIQWGIPVEALDILRVAQRENVPGFGRQRAVALLRQGIETFDQLLTAAKDKVQQAVGGEKRMSALLHAVASCIGFRQDKFREAHRQLAERLGVEALVERCNDALGTDYEDAVIALLTREPSWSIRQIDDGRQQNAPDLLLTLGVHALLIECKTTTKKPPLLAKEAAFAILQKALGYDKAMHRVTLGKPRFDEHSRKKAQAAEEVTLIEHEVFIEGVLRVLAGKVTPRQLVEWLIAPGLTELDRLGGPASYQILANDKSSS